MEGGWAPPGAYLGSCVMGVAMSRAQVDAAHMDLRQAPLHPRMN